MSEQNELEPPSEEFLRAFVHSASPAITCELCGRINYDLSGTDMDPGELDGLNKKQKAEPDKYFGQDNRIDWGTIDGKQFAADCPCNKVREFENWIWHHRQEIGSYLKARLTLEVTQTTRQLAELP